MLQIVAHALYFEIVMFLSHRILFVSCPTVVAKEQEILRDAKRNQESEGSSTHVAYNPINLQNPKLHENIIPENCVLKI